MPKESTKKKNIDAIMEFNDNSSLDSPTRPRKNLNFKTQKQSAARHSISINTIATKAAGDYLSDDGNGLTTFVNQSDNVMQNKRKKLETFTIGAIKTSQQKVSELLDKQSESRKENREKLSRNLNAVLEQYQQDLSKMKDNEEKLQKMLTSQVKASQQATASHAQTLMAVRDMHSAYEKQTEGLLRSGAMRAEDRPLWWDIYRAFPPLVEPLFSRPSSNISIRPIFYEEDNLRAKFHQSGESLGTVKLTDFVNKSNTQKLIDIHKQLKAESTDFEEDLYNKCVSTLHAQLGTKPAEHQAKYRESQHTDDPRSVTSQTKQTNITSNLKDIFKE